MTKSKKSSEKSVDENTSVYEGYEMRWLREIPEHPDFKLVAEYDALMAKKEEK